MDPFSGRPLREVTENDLQGLIDREVGESLYLDYKRDFDIMTSNDGQQRKRREFLQDVTAFANSRGGLLIFGIEERKDEKTGIPGSLPGIQCADSGKLKSLVEALFRDGIDERLCGYVEVETVDLKNEKVAVLVRIPPSVRAPHAVSLYGERKFYRRVNQGNEPMTTSQIRESVLRSEDFEERTRRRLEQRRSALREQFPNVPFGVLHVMPVAPNSRILDMASAGVIKMLEKLGPAHPPHEGRGPDDWRASHRLEGFQLDNFPVRREEVETGEIWKRMLFQRDGIVEFVDAYTFRNRSDTGIDDEPLYR